MNVHSWKADMNLRGSGHNVWDGIMSPQIHMLKYQSLMWLRLETGPSWRKLEWHPNFIELVSLEEKEGTVESSLSLAPPFPCSPFPSPSSPLLSSLPPLSNLCLLAWGKERPCEAVMRRQRSVSREGSSHQEQNQMKPWSWTSKLWGYKKIYFCCLSHTV